MPRCYIALGMSRKGERESTVDRFADALPGLVWTALPNGEVDFVNRRWCEFTGLGTMRDPVDAYLLYGRAATAMVPRDSLAAAFASAAEAPPARSNCSTTASGSGPKRTRCVRERMVDRSVSARDERRTK